MHRVDNATAAAALPAPTADGPNPDGFYTGGDPAGAIPATVVEAEHLNMIQEELAGAIEAAGLELDKSDRAQLVAAIAIIAAQTPNSAFLNILQNWTKPQIAMNSGLGDITGSVAIDLATAQDFERTTTGDITLANPVNIAAAVNQKGTISIDNSGDFALSGLGTFWKRINGSGAPVFPAGACRFEYHVKSATRIEYSFGEVEA